MSMTPTPENGFDATIMDRENNVVAFVEVKAHPVDRWARILPAQLAKAAQQAAFVLAIDPNDIRLFRPDGDNLGEPIVELDTRQVLRHYDPDFPKKRVFESYLLTLVEAWLRDLAYHWKSEHPPGSDELDRAGLLEKLAGGTTQALGA
jgi:hypothetical protein